MFNMKGWLRGLKPFEPVVISLSDQKTVFRKIAAITANSSFDAVKTDMIEHAARLIARDIAQSARSTGIDPFHSSWDAVVNTVEGAPKSEKILKEYLRSEGLRSDSEYYVLLMNFGDGSDT